MATYSRVAGTMSLPLAFVFSVPETDAAPKCVCLVVLLYSRYTGTREMLGRSSAQLIPGTLVIRSESSSCPLLEELPDRCRCHVPC